MEIKELKNEMFSFKKSDTAILTDDSQEEPATEKQHF